MSFTQLHAVPGRRRDIPPSSDSMSSFRAPSALGGLELYADKGMDRTA